MSSTESLTKLYDPIRKSWVKATPEELVRQNWLNEMIRKGYPKELIAIERELASLPHLSHLKRLPRRRIDILCFAKEIHPQYPFYPLLIIECKEDKITEKGVNQLIGYNAFVKSYYVGIAGQSDIRVGSFDRSLGEYRFASHLPDFQELLDFCLKGLSESSHGKRD